MKPEYVKPSVELVRFETSEPITNAEDEFIPGLDGSEGFEEW